MIETIELYKKPITKTVYGIPISCQPVIEVHETANKLILCRDPLWLWCESSTRDLVGLYRVAQVLMALDGEIGSPNILFIFCAMTEEYGIQDHYLNKEEIQSYLRNLIGDEMRKRILERPVPESIITYQKRMLATTQ